MALPDLLRAWRAEAGVKLRRDRPLPQTEVAQRMGVSERWYRGLENGVAVSLTPEVLRRLADALELGPDERMALHGKALGGAALVAPESMADPIPALSRLIAAQRNLPAYLTDHAWNIRGYNGLMADWFPWVTEPGANLMRWALTTEEARAQLGDWRGHAEVYLALLRFALVGHPEDRELGDLLEETLRDPETRQVWDRGPRVVAYRQGHRYRLSLPHVSPGELVVTSQVLVPAYHQSIRCVVLVPVDDATSVL
ncbi:helix-turn-helix transcriptional regulator [Streptomyces sp. NBC_00249]|uniref:helix-turn-helix domain-containing protein n=1 Tax=Streptomyces sp. NBC_00249 TaxID=2975690 RepID=UPI00224D3B37|nr:helix-turn-helix domain-containing protein [Streptomyces sp. NBC_00249]MCX5196460.1 helix-turn-helix transcriptional regulator [Streptomyces sp. NBC_00249]